MWNPKFSQLLIEPLPTIISILISTAHMNYARIFEKDVETLISLNFSTLEVDGKTRGSFKKYLALVLVVVKTILRLRKEKRNKRRGKRLS